MNHEEREQQDPGHQDREDLIRERAQQIWEREGRQDGDHERHWRQAEQELAAEQGQQQGSDTSSSDLSGGASGSDA